MRALSTPDTDPPNGLEQERAPEPPPRQTFEAFYYGKVKGCPCCICRGNICDGNHAGHNHKHLHFSRLFDPERW